MIFNIVIGLWAFTMLALVVAVLFGIWFGVQEVRHWWAGGRWGTKVMNAPNPAELQRLVEEHNAECLKQS